MAKLKSFGLLIYLSALLPLSSCDKDDCDEEETVEYYVTLIDTAGNPVEPDRYYTIRRSNENIVNEAINDTSRVYPPPGHFLVLKDIELFGNESFRFVAIRDSVKIVDEIYWFNYDGCHIVKTAGKDSIVVE